MLTTTGCESREPAGSCRRHCGVATSKRQLSARMIVISSIDRARRRILVTASGRLTAKDMLAHIKQEQDDGLLSFSELVDARGAQPAFSPADLRVVVDLIHRFHQASAVGAAE